MPETQSGLESWEVLDLLTSLVLKSLVVHEEDEQGHGRYRLLETVRQYSRDRLLGSGEGAAIRSRHQAFFLALAEEDEPELAGPDQDEWLDRLEGERENPRAALEWAAEAADGPDRMLRLVTATGSFWRRRSGQRLESVVISLFVVTRRLSPILSRPASITGSGSGFQDAARSPHRTPQEPSRRRKDH